MSKKDYKVVESLAYILNLLDRGEIVTRRHLARHLNVHPRSVDRYLAILHKTEFPIYYDRQKRSYRFAQGYGLKKANFTTEESLVFALAKGMVRKFSTGAEKVMETLERKMGYRTAILPPHIILAGEDLAPTLEEYLIKINEAIIDHRQIEIVYRTTRKHDEEKCRVVDPYYLFFVDTLWYMRGYCRLKKAATTFALDKIVSLKVLNKHFVPDQKICPVGELQVAFGPYVDGKPMKVVLRFDAKAAPFIKRKKWHSTQTVKELPNGGIEVRYSVNGLAGIKPWILRWIPHVEVVGPKELRRLVREEMRVALESNS